MKLFSIVPAALAIVLAFAIPNNASEVARETPVASIDVAVVGMYAVVTGPSLCSLLAPEGHCECCPGFPSSCQSMPYGTLCKYTGGGSGVTYVPVYDCW